MPIKNTSRAFQYLLSAMGSYGPICLILASFSARASEDVPLTVPAIRSPVGVDADPDTLLRTLAQLARVGLDALCDPAYLENSLNIKIEATRFGGNALIRRSSARVRPKSEATEFSQATYATFSNESVMSCSIAIQFKRNLLCDPGSLRVEKLVGARAEFTAPFPGRTTQGIFYTFNPSSGNSSSMELGFLGDKCVTGFVVGAEGIVK